KPERRVQPSAAAELEGKRVGMRGDRAGGLCETVITREDVLEERVVLFRSVLYCSACAPRVPRLRRETLIKASKFDKNGDYACSRCPAPLSSSELEAAKFTLHEGELFCLPCSDLKTLLAPKKPAPAQEAAVDICAACSGLIAQRDVDAGLTLVVDGETYCKQCRRDR